ncbi:MAG: Copper tolerance protein [Myxococcales bacterium]|nr:Copper tolerance protein [Myxococcales bacterium]
MATVSRLSRVRHSVMGTVSSLSRVVIGTVSRLCHVVPLWLIAVMGAASSRSRVVIGTVSRLSRVVIGTVPRSFRDRDSSTHALLFIVCAASCVPSTSQLRQPVDAELARRIGAPLVSRDPKLVQALLAEPLDSERAVRIALANNARVAAAFDELGIAGGELASALSLGPLHVDGQLRAAPEGHEYELEVVQNVLGVIAMPRRRAAARADLAAARANAIASVLRLAAHVEIAFDDLIAAEHEVELRRTAFDAADAAATVRERMYAAGNTTDLAQARDRDAREQARLDLGRAEAAVETRREALDALLGLSGDQTKWTSGATLPLVPETAPSLDDLETAAVAASLDLTSGRARAEAAANRLGAENLRAFLPELGLGVSVIWDSRSSAAVGPAIRLGIPLFDQRSGDRARARAEQQRTDHELIAIAVELRAGARAARVAALAAYAEARHLRDIVLPLRQQIVDETLLHYNAMDADPFQLIAARRDLAEAGHQYLDAVRRYANAMAEVTALRRGVQLDPVSARAPRASEVTH